MATKRTICAVAALTVLAAPACSSNGSHDAHRAPSTRTAAAPTGAARPAPTASSAGRSQTSAPSHATTVATPGNGNDSYCIRAAGIGAIYLKIAADPGSAQQLKSQVDAIENGVPGAISGLIENLHDALIQLIDGGRPAVNKAQPQISSDMGQLDAWMHVHCPS